MTTKEQKASTTKYKTPFFGVIWMAMILDSLERERLKKNYNNDDQLFPKHNSSKNGCEIREKTQSFRTKHCCPMIVRHEHGDTISLKTQMIG